MSFHSVSSNPKQTPHFNVEYKSEGFDDIHSYYSDGVYSPREIVRLSKNNGLKTIALTDHNSVEGIREAIKEGEKEKIRVIPGAELRSKEGEILGYFIDYKNDVLREKIKEIQDRSEEVFDNAIKIINKKGLKIKKQEILDTKFKQKNVLIVYLIKYLKKHNLMEIKKFKNLLKGGGFEPKYSAEEIIKIIRDSGGVPVLAHPWYSPELIQSKK